MSLMHFNSRRLKYLWMDDEIDTIRNYASLVSRDRPNVAFEFAETIDDAWDALDNGAYSGFVVDCRMSQHDESANGATMLLDVNRRSKAFPTFVYSAFLDDPKYAHVLSQSYVIAQESKAETFDMPLSNDPFFVALLNTGLEYEAVRLFEPERIEFRDYDLHPEKYSDHVRAHWRKHRRWIQADMARQGLKWVIVCGEQIVKASADLHDLPTENEIVAVGAENNLIPFTYSTVTLPEDLPEPRSRSPWKMTTVGNNDIYPCLMAVIDGVEVVDDFDTGAAATFVSDELLPPGKWNFWAESDQPHLGRDFEYLPKKVPVTIVAHDGERQTRPHSVLVIKEWRNSTFTVFNPERRVLFGRDLLRAFDVEITLHGKTKETSVRILT